MKLLVERCSSAVLIVVLATVAGCAQPGAATSNTGSGITMYGVIDQGINVRK